jgi:hypothetical protein
LKALRVEPAPKCHLRAQEIRVGNLKRSAVGNVRASSVRVRRGGDGTIGGTDMLWFPGPECVDFGVNSFFPPSFPGLGLVFSQGLSAKKQGCRNNEAFTSLLS